MSIKHLLSGFVTGILAFGAVFSMPVALAQTSTGQIPAGFSVAPIQNWDRGDDAIVQLNTLTIQSISGSMIYASPATAQGCLGYATPQSSGRAISCPMIPPTMLYQISVGGDTILLLKNRQRTSLGSFAVGDRINVFGFLDRSSQLMQALIVRDLDKPSLQTASYYTQFNNVRAVGAPSASYPPATLDIVFSPTPCALYDSAQYRISTPCPYVSSAPSGIFALAKHTVNITSETVVLNQYRQTMALGAVQSDDTLNVFGRYNPSTGVIDALILRDLSSNGTVTIGNSSLAVTVVNDAIRCITTPCGLVANASVVLSADNNSTPSYNRVTASNGLAYFGNLAAGSYTVSVTTICPAGYACAAVTAASQKVYISSGENKSITVLINNQQSSSQLQVISPNGGETLTRGSQYAIRWTVPPTPAGQFSAGSSYDISVIRRTVGGDFVANLLYPVAKGVYLDFGMTSGSYVWTVGQNQSGGTMDDGGNYIVQICYAGTSTCDTSDGKFTVNSLYPPFQSLQIYSLTPQSGTPGTTVTVSGTGFASTGNIVRLEMANGASVYLPNIASNGTTLTFSVPAYSSYSCQYSTNGGPICAIASTQLQPGVYRVWVENTNGVSNSAQFTLTSGSVTQLPQISSITPQGGVIGTTVTITGSGFTAGDNRIIFGQYQAASVASNGTSLTFTVPAYMGANCAANQYCPMYAAQTQPGIYNVHIENANGSSNSVQFTVQSGTSGGVQIYSVNPAAVSVNNSVTTVIPNGGATISGTGFTPTGNRVIFGQYEISPISSDGSTLVFTPQSYMSRYCDPGQVCSTFAIPLAPGQYLLRVQNANGVSNNLNFQIY
jgi:hypothetical protein